MKTAMNPFSNNFRRPSEMTETCGTIKDKIFSLEQKLKEDIAISKEDYAFLVKYAGYEEAEEFVFCDQEMMDFMRQFGGATNTEELKLEDLRARIRENEAQLHKRIIKV